MVKGGRDSGGARKSGDEKEMRTEMPAHSEQPVTEFPLGPIGDQIRHLYNEVISEPVPDRFIELLKQLERSTTNKR